MKGDRPRILWLKSAIPWPLDQGTNFIAYNLFRLLSPDYEIDYLALRGGPDDDARLDALRPFVAVEALTRPNRRSRLHRLAWAAAYRIRRRLAFVPPEVHYELPRAYRRAVRRRLESGRYALLFFHYWFLGELGPWLSGHNVAALLHDYEPDRLRLATETLPPGSTRRNLLRIAEWSFRSHLRLVERVRHVFFYTEEDRDRFFADAGREFPNAGIFPYFYRLTDLPEVAEEPETVLFSGKMSYLPNVLAAERLATRIWPRIREARSSARLVLAGRNPGPRVRALADVPGVEVTGYLEDLRARVRAAAVYVAPVDVGGGLKIKLMEAAELERPLVSTAFALAGFDFRPGEEYLPAETDEEFAAAILSLLDDAARRRRLGRAARNALIGRFSGPEVEARARALFRRLTERECDPTPKPPAERR